MVSADSSEPGRIGIRLGLRAPLRSVQDGKSDLGSGGLFVLVGQSVGLVEVLGRQEVAGRPSARTVVRKRRGRRGKGRGTGPCPDGRQLGPLPRSAPDRESQRSGHKKPRKYAGLDDSMPDPTSSSMVVAMGGLEP